MLTLIRCPFHLALPQWHAKDPGHSAKNAGGRLHLKMHTSLTQRSRSGLSKHRVGAYQGNELTRNSSGNTRPQSSQLAEPLWTDPGVKSGISVREPISISKKKKKKGADRECTAKLFKKIPAAMKKPPCHFLEIYSVKARRYL